MPVNIYSITSTGEKNKDIVWLCDGNWRLQDQAQTLVTWLSENGSTLRPGCYIADIGFTPRHNALGGGAAFPPEAMRAMADLGISLFLSEYPM